MEAEESILINADIKRAESPRREKIKKAFIILLVVA